MASIADILIAKGNAGARGVSERGNIYANLIGNLGSLPGQFMQEQRQQRAEDARQQEAQARTAIAKGQLEQQNREFDAQQQGQQAQSRVDAVLGSGVYDDAGNIDLAKVQERAAQTDPSLVPHAVAAAQKLNEHAASYRKTMTEADEAAMRLNEKKATAVADIADTLASNPSGIDAGNYQLAIGTLAKNKVIDPRQAEEWLQADTPEAMAANVAAMRAGAKRAAGEVKEFDPTKELRDTRTGAVIRPAQAKAEKLTFQKPETFMVNGKRTLVRAGSDGQLYDMKGKVITTDVQPEPEKETGGAPIAVMGPDGKPVLVKPSESYGRQPASTRETGRQVPAATASKIGGINQGLDQLGELGATLKATENATGVGAQVGAALWNPITNITGWGADAKKRQAVIDRVKQIIGKGLEDGVLRKEDEEKYKAILPTIGDPPDVASSKLRGLQSALTDKRKNEVDALADAGYDTSKFEARNAGGGMISVTAPNGKTYNFKSQADADAFKSKF